MTADEIRTLEKMRYGYDDGAKTALFEIAAQLAEMNARFASVQMPEGVISVGLCSTNDNIRVRLTDQI